MSDELVQARREFAAARREMAELRRRALAYFTMMRYARRNKASGKVTGFFSECIREVFEKRRHQRLAIVGIRRGIAQHEQVAWKHVAMTLGSR